jgi:surfeit locus 1 family protein
MKRVPLIATLIVGLACLTMVGLGVWQLKRMAWKEGLLAEYAAAKNRPEINYPVVPLPQSSPFFRRSSLVCLEVTGWTPVSGRNLAGASGWKMLAQCRTSAEGPGAVVDAGWSTGFLAPPWKGGQVSGIIAPDTRHIIRLVSDKPLAPGLMASAPPSPDDIANNHFAYAVQWFLFAALAAGIYGLALRRRLRA